MALEMPHGCHRAVLGRMRKHCKLQVLPEASLSLLQNQYLVGNIQFSKNQIGRSLQEGKREKQNKTNQTPQGIVIVTIYESRYVQG